MSDISEIQVGGTTYTIADATAREDIADLHNATVHIVDKNIDINGGAPTASIYDRGITFDDVDGNSIGFIQLDHETDGNYGISFGVNTLDDSVTHQIALELKSDGTPKCWISQPTVVRNALSAAASSHTHGSISNTGAITSDTTVTSGDKLIIADDSDSSKLKRSNIALGTSTTTFLRNDGTWATPPNSGGGIPLLENEGLPINSSSPKNTDMERRLYYAAPDVSQGIVAYLTLEDNTNYDLDLMHIVPYCGTRIYVIFDASLDCSLADCFGSYNEMRLAAVDSQSQEVTLCPSLPVVGGNGDYLSSLYGNNLVDTTAVFEFRLVNIFNSQANEPIDAWMLVGGNPRKGGGSGSTQADTIETIANAVMSAGSTITVDDFGDDYLSLSDTANRFTSWYGTSSTTASTTAKTITCSTFPSYRAGDVITILFTYANTATAPTLNVNSKGIKSVYVNNAIASASNPCIWPANTLVTFVYDGTYYRYLGQQRGGKSFYGTCSTTTQTLVGTCAEYELTKGSLITLQMTAANENTSAKTLNVNSTGAKNVYYNNAATSTSNTLTWKSGEILQFIYDGSYYRFVGRSSGGEVEIPNEIVVSTTEPTSTDTMLWIDPSSNATTMAAGVSF